MFVPFTGDVRCVYPLREMSAGCTLCVRCQTVVPIPLHQLSDGCILLVRHQMGEPFALDVRWEDPLQEVSDG